MLLSSIKGVYRLKSKGMLNIFRRKAIYGLSFILILKGILTFLRSKSPCILLIKIIKFNKNIMESKTENPTQF